MKEREWQVGIFGTFDVENYGDLLFPLIAEAELNKRLGSVTLHRFSYRTKTLPEWPYAVTSVAELPRLVDSFDCVLIGGGFIVRFDKVVAEGYEPPTAAIHHPTGYWLTPALLALQHGVPLVWNGPGMHCNPIPEWAEPLLRLSLTYSRYIAVRDELTQAALTPFANGVPVNVLPDTGFGVGKLVNTDAPSAEFLQLRDQMGLQEPYILVQAVTYADRFAEFVRQHASKLQGYRFLVLPIGPALGHHESHVGELPRRIVLPAWPHPSLLAEIVSHAEAVIGFSYHLIITALSFGVPIFCLADLSVGKYTALSNYETIFPLPDISENDFEVFFSRLGRKPVSSLVLAAERLLEDYWDMVAELIREGRTETATPLNQFWQSLPILLETASESVTALQADGLKKQQYIETLNQQVASQIVSLTSVADQVVALQLGNSEKQQYIETLNQQIVSQTVSLTSVADRVAALQTDSLEKQQHIEKLNHHLTSMEASLAEKEQLLALAHADILFRDARLEQLFIRSSSMKITAPARVLVRALKRLAGKK